MLSANETRPAQAIDGGSSISALIGELTSDNLRARREARERLARLGQQAVAPLLTALEGSDEQLRWEAAKTLVELQSPDTVPALIRALEDEDGDIRWLAAEALVAHGQVVVVPLLELLEHRSDSVYLRQGAHHVLSELAGGDMAPILLPVVAALEDVEPVLEAPVAAFRALEKLAAAS